MDRIPNSLNVIINELDSLDFVSNSDVEAIVNYANPTLNDLNTYSLFNHCNTESYGRQLIADIGNFKLLLMSWKPGDFTAIHNHGNAQWGCVRFFGDAEHRLYNTVNNKLILTESTSFKNGDIASVCGDLTHLMGNSSSKEFFTLHIYGSDTHNKNISEGAIVYIPEDKSVVTTNGSAYVNMDSSLKITNKPFNNIAQDALIDYFSLIKPFYHRNKKHDKLNKIELYEQKLELFYK